MLTLVKEELQNKLQIESFLIKEKILDKIINHKNRFIHIKVRYNDLKYVF